MTNPTKRPPRVVYVVLGLLMMLGLTTACGTSAEDSWDQAFNGLRGTLRTYDVNGVAADEIKGSSFRISRDDEFDTTDSDGKSQNDSSVLLVSLGKHHMHFVGSTTILVQDGLNDVTAQVPAQFRFTNRDSGTPWLNDLKYRFFRYWKNDAKTIVIKSQFGTPLAVYTGEDVQLKGTDVPKSTWFRIKGADGQTRTLWVYRATYSVVDTALLGK